MLKWFYCPDEEKIEVQECLKKCRLGRRCLTRPTLTMISEDRPWTGQPSTTQLLNGTEYSFLKLTKDYAIKPKSRAFMLLGTQHHQRLEEVAKVMGIMSEQKLTGEITGILDLIEIEDDEVVLSDYKTFGSFKVAKSLGLKPSGKGQYTQSEDDAEMIDIELQLNNYRLMLKKQLGISVDRMQVQVTVRDGDLWSARKAGVDDSMYMIPVKMLDDDEVEKYFKNKAERLLLAMKQGYWGVACNEHESWKTRKCKKYCEVWEHCLQGMEVHL